MNAGSRDEHRRRRKNSHTRRHRAGIERSGFGTLARVAAADQA